MAFPADTPTITRTATTAAKDDRELIRHIELLGKKIEELTSAMGGDETEGAENFKSMWSDDAPSDDPMARVAGLLERLIDKLSVSDAPSFGSVRPTIGG